MPGQITLTRTHAGAVAHVTVDHDAKLNTLNPDLMRDFVAAFATLSADPALRAVVLTGAGARAFIGGADITVMAGIDSEAGGEAFIRLVHACCRAVRDCPVPVIARVNGWCLGAGLEVAAACDLRIAAEGAKFGMPEVRVGIPSVVEAALLPGLIGWGRTRRLLLLAETIGAAEALDWGLLERVVPDAALDAAVEAWIGLLLEAGPEAIRAQKALIRRWEDLPLSQAIAAGIYAFAASWRTEEPARMLGGFLAAKARRAARD
ncbi:enoyl-CoA hydratase/isomerase family protein [Roseomonas sp. PWR1]|uniref:Enoyl-CoA hydratase/isomerase family protein n=1 Tax=Roseomonas nitratireducens TaxID=2820810 RepID=A0ABS4AV09_9PROT|nr:enoyl-CoA hydratase [Neoroseomonas nitratireducens]MBP0464668.1 enoyl-CoA hydratase/isomerase family protein [Neoroseomonas nitratireducens]